MLDEVRRAANEIRAMLNTVDARLAGEEPDLRTLDRHLAGVIRTATKARKQIRNDLRAREILRRQA